MFLVEQQRPVGITKQVAPKPSKKTEFKKSKDHMNE